jgi:hypothetical protein
MVTGFVRVLMLIIAVPSGVVCAMQAMNTDPADNSSAVLLGIVCVLALLVQGVFARLSQPY